MWKDAKVAGDTMTLDQMLQAPEVFYGAPGREAEEGACGGYSGRVPCGACGPRVLWLLTCLHVLPPLSPQASSTRTATRSCRGQQQDSWPSLLLLLVCSSIDPHDEVPPAAHLCSVSLDAPLLLPLCPAPFRLCRPLLID